MHHREAYTNPLRRTHQTSGLLVQYHQAIPIPWLYLTSSCIAAAPRPAAIGIADLNDVNYYAKKLFTDNESLCGPVKHLTI